MSSLLFGFAIDGTERLRKSTGVEIVDSWLSFTLLKMITENKDVNVCCGRTVVTYNFQIGLLLVGLLEVETLLVPVLYTHKETILRLA